MSAPPPRRRASWLPARPSLLGAALRLAEAPPSAAPLVLWSVAEPPPPPAVYVAKPLLDAYRPANATLSLALAGVNALVIEAQRTDKLEALVRYVEGEDDDEDDGAGEEAWDWPLVAFNTSAAFARDTIAQTLLRTIEKGAKAYLPTTTYHEILKNMPKLSSHVYQKQCKECGSKWRASAAASAIVLRSATFYCLRSVTSWVADVFVDAIQLCRGKLTERNFKSNAFLKAYKYSLSGVFCFSLGTMVPFLYTHPWMFLFSDLVAGFVADTFVGYVGVIDAADGRPKKK